MLCAFIFAVLFATTSAQKFQTSTDELENFLVNALNNNETFDFDFNNYTTKPCEPYVNEKPDFTAPGRRVSEAKCLEYIWEMENRENETEWGQICRLYLISEIKKGVLPEILSAFFIIQSPVIFGGRPASHGEFPHMGAVGWPAKNSSEKWSFKCGSTLISDKFLLTAAHCSRLSVKRVRDIARSRPEIVRLGVENIADDEFNINGDPVDVKIKRFIVHPKYTPPKKYFDIALIELETKVKFANNLQPACLWSKENVIGKEGTLTGWGYTEKGALSPQLQAAVVDFIDTEQCDNILNLYRNRHWRGFREHQICAGKLGGGIDTCQGDSGGPLQVQIPSKTEGKIYWTVAVTSFGFKCGHINRPGVYTRVSSFIDWIEDIVWGSENKSLSPK